MNAEELEQIWELLDRITTYPESAVDNVDEINEVLARFRDLAPVPSGEVETPCATCGGSGTDAAGISDAPCDICGGSGITPDCGVETPEAAVEAVLSSANVSRNEAKSILAALRAQGWTPPGGEER